MGGSTYGFELDPDLHRRLRGDPPASVLEWVRTALDARRVTLVQPLAGGTSSAVHRVTLESGAGVPVVVVLRRFVLEWLDEEPDAPSNEARILRLLADTPIKAPRLIAADVDGSQTGTPAVLMSSLAGQLEWRPTGQDRWLRQLAEALVEIQQVRGVDGLDDWYPYAPPDELLPPPWTRHPRAWETALAQYAGPVPEARTVFLHRDYHPGNVLWSDGTLSGIVDWIGGCRGPAEQDVSHCRANLAVNAGMVDAADRFLELWQAMTGQSGGYDPYWDLVDVVSWVGDTPDPALDEFVARAAAQLH